MQWLWPFQWRSIHSPRLLDH